MPGKRETYNKCLDLAIVTLPALVTRNADGKVALIASSANPGIEDLESLIAGAIPYSDGIPRENLESLVFGSFLAFGENLLAGGAADRTTLDGCLQAAFQKYQAKSRETYTLFSQISIHRGSFAEGKHSCGQITVEIKSDMPDDAPQESELCLQLRSLSVHKPIQSWMWIRVPVMARDAQEAFDLTLAAVTKLRGKWNFAKNRSFYSTMSFPSPKAINKIRLGPLQVLRAPDGTIAPIWYFQDSEAGARSELWNPTKSVAERVLKEADFITSRLAAAKTSYRYSLEENLANYASALDESDHSSILLKLWTIAESLTNCSETNRANHDLLVNRATRCLDGGDYFKVVLENLRGARHALVHDLKTVFSQTAMHQLVRVVNALLFFHVNNCHEFQSIKEACDYLDLSNNIEQLKREIEIRQRAVNRLEAKAKAEAESSVNNAGPLTMR
jgi:hypothetical protein